MNERNIHQKRLPRFSYNAAMLPRDYPLTIVFHATATLELAYTKGHHDAAEVERQVLALSKVSGSEWVEPQHGWWRLLRGRQPSAAAPGTQGAFPVTWMERRR
jgi:hypothetical protein